MQRPLQVMAIVVRLLFAFITLYVIFSDSMALFIGLFRCNQHGCGLNRRFVHNWFFSAMFCSHVPFLLGNNISEVHDAIRP